MLTKLLIVCPLIFLAGFIDSIAGGGGLISLPGYLIAGLPPINAIATNKLSSCTGTVVTLARFSKEGCVPWRDAVVGIPFGFIGSWIGTRIALSIDDAKFKLILLIILPLTAAYVLLSRGLKNAESTDIQPLEATKLRLFIALISLVIGVYDGFYGPGAGTFLLLLLNGLARLPVRKAAGLGKAINFTTNLTAMVSYLVSGKTLFAIGIPAAICSIIGNWFGSRCFLKNGTRIVKPVMLCVLGIFFIKTIVEIVG